MLWFVQHFKKTQHNDTTYIIKTQSAILSQICMDRIALFTIFSHKRYTTYLNSYYLCNWNIEGRLI